MPFLTSDNYNHCQGTLSAPTSVLDTSASMTERADAATGFYGRLKDAMEAEGKSPTRTQRECGFQSGYLTSLKQGKIQSPSPEAIRRLADYLHVSFEWLAIGRGTMRVAGASGSPREDALRFARAVMHAREDVIDAVLDRYVGTDLSAFEWLTAIDLEHRRLERLDIPALAKEKARLVRELAELEAKPARARRRP